MRPICLYLAIIDIKNQKFTFLLTIPLDPFVFPQRKAIFTVEINTRQEHNFSLLNKIQKGQKVEIILRAEKGDFLDG